MLKSFFIRLCSSIVILLVYLSMYFFRESIYLNIVIALIGGAAVYEFCHATKMPESNFLLFPSLLFALAAPFANIFIAFLYIAILFIYLIVDYEKINILNIFEIGFINTIIVISLNCIVLLRNYPHFAYILPLCVAASITDTFCYIVGITFGRHKLAPKVSPNKSIEGAIGGTVITAFVFVGYGAFLNSRLSLDINLIIAFATGLIYAVLAQAGDLSESAIKRHYGIKDFGNIIPGHGGVLDRIDSWLFTTPIVLYIAILLGGI